MRARSLASAGLVAGFLAAVMSLGVAMPAQAVSAYPDGWNPKQFMVNTTSRIMAAAGSSKAQRALIANSQKYDHGWETLQQQFKERAATGAPDTFTDYAINAQESFLKDHTLAKPGDTSGKTYKNPVTQATLPATKAQQLTKKIGAASDAASILGSAYFGFQVGKGISGLMGLGDDGICAPTFEDGGMIALITGTDCSAYFQNGPAFDANADIASTLAPGGDCGALSTHAAPTTSTTFSSWTVQCRSMIDWRYKYPNMTKYPGGAWTVQAVTENPDHSYNIQWTFSGPPLATGETGSQLLPTIQLYVNGVYGCTMSIPNFYAAANYASSGTWKTGVPSCYTSTKPYGAVLAGRGDGQGGKEGLYGAIFKTGSALSAIQDEDPQRAVQCSITTVSGQTYTQTSSAAPREGADGKVAPPECPALPDGEVMANGKLVQTGGPEPVTIADQPTTQEYQDFMAQYPECTLGACSLDLIDKRGTTDVSCFDSASSATACASWFTSPTRDTDYQCTYGAHDTDLSDCYVYAQVFSPEKIAAGQAYADPLTGESVQGQSSPSAANEAMNKPAMEPGNVSGCLETGWAEANPVEWVLVPVQCALQWAFVPRPSVVDADFQQIEASGAGKMPAQVAAVVGNWGLVAPADGCAGITVPAIGPAESVHIPAFQIMQACAGDMLQPVALWSRIFGDLAFTVLGAVAVTRNIGRIVNYDGVGSR